MGRYQQDAVKNAAKQNQNPAQKVMSALSNIAQGSAVLGMIYLQRKNAAAEAGDPDSVYSFYKKLTALRKARPVIQAGHIEFLYRDDPDLPAYRRWDGESELLVLCNLTAHDAPVALPGGWQTAGVLLDNYPDAAPGAPLRPYEALVLER